MRGRDTSVISVGSVLFSSDKRYQINSVSRPHVGSSVWSLQVDLPTHKAPIGHTIHISCRYTTFQKWTKVGMSAR